MRIITKGHCSDDSVPWGSCTIIEITPATEIIIKQLRAVMTANPCLAQVITWDTSVTYHADGFLDENDEDGGAWPADPALRAQIENVGYLVLPPGLEPPFIEDTIRVESASVCVDDYHVWWRALVRHGDAHVETALIKLEDMDCPIHWGDDAARVLCMWCAVGASWR